MQVLPSMLPCHLFSDQCRTLSILWRCQSGFDIDNSYNYGTVLLKLCFYLFCFLDLSQQKLCGKYHISTTYVFCFLYATSFWKDALLYYPSRIMTSQSMAYLNCLSRSWSEHQFLYLFESAWYHNDKLSLAYE